MSAKRIELMQHLLAAFGYPTPPEGLLHSAGAARFLRGWSARLPGTPSDLEAILKVVDAGARVECSEERGAAAPIAIASGMALFGARPARRRVRVRITWERRDLLPHCNRLLRWCDAVAGVWLPLAFDEYTLWHGWRNGLAAGSGNVAAADAPPSPSGCPRRWRRTEAATLAVLSVHGAARLHEAGSLVVADAGLRCCLANAMPFVPSWREQPGEATQAGEARWQTSGDAPFVDVLAAADGVTWSLNGRPHRAARLGNGVYRLRLEQPLRGGDAIRLACRRSDGRPVAIYPNPVVFQTVLHTTEATRAGTYGLYEPKPLAAAMAAHRCEMLLAGSAGVDRVVQPLPVTPEAADAFAMLHRGCDVRRRLERAILGAQVDSADMALAWDGRSPPRRVLELPLRGEFDPCVTEGALLRAALALLRHRLPAGIDVRVFLKEKCHEERTTEGVATGRGVPRRVRARRTKRASRRTCPGARTRAVAATARRRTAALRRS
jgi:hypothetical protein